jgi:hypothetical protein
MTRFTRTMIVILATGAASLGAVALAADTPKPAADTPKSAAATPADTVQARKDWIQHRLDDVAARLEIKASQQAAWQSYAASVLALGDVGTGMRARPAADADAATIARARAEHLTLFARKLTDVADATARLQGVLSPEQRSVLTEVTRNAGMHGMHGGFGPHGGYEPWMMRHPMRERGGRAVPGTD